MATADLRFALFRPDDLCVLQISFHNAKLVDGEGYTEVAAKGPGPVLVSVQLPPQHIVEQIVREGDVLSPAELPTAMSGPSVLWFRMPSQELPMRLSSAKLFDVLLDAPMLRDGRARAELGLLADPEPTSTPPATSFLELPQGLFLVPDPSVTLPLIERWAVSPPRRNTAEYQALAELWRVTFKTPVRLEAVFAHPVQSSADPVPNRRALARDARYAIWKPFGDEPEQEGWRWSVVARRLQLSALGASYDLRGTWGYIDGDDPATSPDGVAVESWLQQGTLGRDHFVRVVTPGTLFPLQHQAALIAISERRFSLTARGEAPAVLWKREFLVVRQRERAYASRAFPFQRVRILTEVTPNLAPNDSGNPCFWPKLESTGEVVLFEIEGDDLGGRTSRWKMPLEFVPNDATLSGTDIEGYCFTDHAKRPFDSQDLAYITLTGAPDEQGSFRTSTFTFGAESTPGTPPGYAPLMASAKIEVDALRELAGSAAPVLIHYNVDYLSEGFTLGKNPTGIFADIDTDVRARFSTASDRVGGLAAPDFCAAALSRDLGPVGGDIAGLMSAEAAGANEPQFDAEKFFAGMLDGAKLFGTISLASVIAPVAAKLVGKLPRFLTEKLSEGAALVQRVAEIRRDLVAAEQSLGSHPLASTLKTSADNLASIDLAQAIAAVTPGSSASLDEVVPRLRSLSSGAGTAIGDALGELTKVSNVRSAAGGTITDQNLQRLYDTRRVLERLKAIIDEVLARIADGAKVAELAQRIAQAREHRIRFEWAPELRPVSLSHPGSTKETECFFWVDPGQGRFRVQVEMSARGGAGGEAGFSGQARLEGFSLRLVPPLHVLTLRFKHIAFIMRAGSAPEIDVAFEENGIDFEGPLRFVALLAKLLPSGGFSDPPALDVSREGIAASFSVGLPNVAVGVFALKNMALGARLHLPFIGKELTIGFNFSERHSPFLLTISCFGGGGYFGIQLSPSGLRSLEAAFEFGASIELSVGIASGEVHVMGGVHYKMERVKRDLDGNSVPETEMVEAVLTAYLRMGGSLDVLGIVSVSMELTLQLTYDFNKDKLWGRAKLVLSVRVLFFKKSFEVEVERRLSGSANDPTFAEMTQPYTLPATDPAGPRTVDPWPVYCGAFAVDGAPAPAPVASATITVDASALTMSVIQAPPVRPHGFAPTASFSFTAAPGAYTIYFPMGAEAIPWRINEKGTVDYDARLEGLLAGSGTTKLTVRGVPITVEVKASNGLFMLDRVTTAWRESGKPHVFVLPPGRDCYRFQLTSGLLDVCWSVTSEGTVEYDRDRWGNILLGHGTESLVVTGLPVRVDATALSSDLLMVVGVHTSWVVTHPSPIALELLPGTYGIQTLASVTALRWKVNEDGSVAIIEPSHGLLEVGADGRTLVLRPRTIQIDATPTGEPLLMVVGVHTGWVPSTGVFPLVVLPGTYRFQFLWGFPSARFTVTNEGEIQIGEADRSVLEAHGDTLIVRIRKP